MLMCVFAYSHFVENPSVGSWEINPCFLGGVLSQLVSEQDQGKTHTEASKNHNNVVDEERLAYIRTIIVSSGGKLTYVFFYATTELHQRRYAMIFGVLILFCYW
jgi:hypothetical protein